MGQLSTGGRERNEIWHKGSLGDEDDAQTSNIAHWIELDDAICCHAQAYESLQHSSRKFIFGVEAACVTWSRCKVSLSRDVNLKHVIDCMWTEEQIIGLSRHLNIYWKHTACHVALRSKVKISEINVDDVNFCYLMHYSCEIDSGYVSDVVLVDVLSIVCLFLTFLCTVLFFCLLYLSVIAAHLCQICVNSLLLHYT